MKLFFQNILLVLISIVISICLFESALRLSGFTYPSWQVRDSEVGFIGLPFAKGWWSLEGRSFVEHNSHGFRDFERNVDKKRNTMRIAVLGDSYTQAREVELEATFVNQAEKMLSSCNIDDGQSIEVLNFGVSAFNIPAQIQLWRSRVKVFQPDWVIFALFLGNDIADSYAKMDPYKNWPGLGLPVFKQSDKGFELDFSFRQDPLFKRRLSSNFHRFALTMINRSIALQFLNYSRHNLPLWIGEQKELEREKLTQRSRITDKNYKYWVGSVKVINSPIESKWKEAWNSAEFGLKVLANEVKKFGSKFAMVLLPHPAQIDKNKSRYPQERLVEWGARNKVFVLDLLPALKHAYEEHKRHPYGFENMVIGDGHWNQLGHDIGAGEIAKWACKLLIVK